MWPQKSIFWILYSFLYPLRSSTSPLPPHSLLSSAKGINSLPTLPELLLSLTAFFCSFLKLLFFQSCSPQFFLFFTQTEPISALQSLLRAPVNPPPFPVSHSCSDIPSPISVSGSSGISPPVPTGSEAATAAGEAAITVRGAACCFPPREVLGRNRYLCVRYLEWVWNP